jgi:hypothetical protein
MYAYSNDFIFLVGANFYSCASFVADSLAPLISKLRSVDPTIYEFVIQAPDPRDNFLSFFALGTGYSVLIDSTNMEFVGSLCQELASVDILRSACQFTGETLNCRTVVDHVVLLCELGVNCESEIEFCASYFYELPSLLLTRLPFPVRAAVLSHKSLTLTNEKSLYEFISDQLERDWEYSSLFACIQLGLLPNETVNHFISLTPTIWTALIPRFALAPLKLPSISRRACSMFVPHSGLFSAGILGYLREQEESNSVHMTKGGNPPPSKQGGSAWVSSQSGTASGDWARALQ